VCGREAHARQEGWKYLHLQNVDLGGGILLLIGRRLREIAAVVVKRLGCRVLAHRGGDPLDGGRVLPQKYT
jgi:hypothetical protein